VLVAQDNAKIERFTRGESGKWIYSVYEGLEAKLELSSINISLALADVYEQVSFP